jgi:hypothetical protein
MRQDGKMAVVSVGGQSNATRRRRERSCLQFELQSWQPITHADPWE